ncbi:g1094 [Coccomyxa viridis]|uniref:G1094 protein n=1 Tax=Coccomyxa viridis TaxID=1274662 RepID=A0ABP1FL52_9CHLO
MHNRRVRTVHPGSKGGGFNPALRPLTQSEHSSAAVKQKFVKKPEGRKATGSDKENAGQQPKPSSEKSLPGYLRATKSSKSKADPPEEWSHTMEDQLHSLQGDFAALKRDSVRLSLAGTENARSGVVPQSPAHASIAARLSALKRESFQAIDNPLSAAGDTPLRELNAPKGTMPASYSTLMPTSRENMRLAAAPDQRMSMSEMDPFEAAGQWDAPSLAQVAEELFSDAMFAEMCERGLTMQLKRTKDGATAETRIAELAGLVKLLRRCLTQMSSRTRSFIETCVKFERGARQQVESLVLARDSAAANHKRELAAAQRDAAQVEAQHKSAAASWHTDLDWHRSELSALRRELERVQGERDRAREDARQAQVARASVEDMAQGTKRETGQQLRELQVEHGAALRQLASVQEAAARVQQQLKADLEAAAEAKEAAESSAAALEADRNVLQQKLDHASEQLETAIQKARQLTSHHTQLSADHTAQSARYEEARVQGADLARQLAAAQERCQALGAECQARTAALDAAQLRLRDALAAQTNSCQQWESQHAALQSARDAALESAAALEAEKAQLKAGLGGALEQRQALEAQLAALSAKQQSLCQAAEAAAAREAEASQRAEQAAQDAAEVRELAQREAIAHETALQEASQKAARLARLEGEMEALQDAIGTGSVDQAEMLGRLIRRVADLEAAVAVSARERRELHNQLVELRGNIRVFCRIKPHPRSAVSTSADGLSVRLHAEGKDQAFTFDRVFGPQADQAAVFQEVSELVQSALDGYKVCLFSYGQTGAGKTHTMQGSKGADGQGIIPRAILKILDEVERLKEQGWQYQLEASFVEVYNETLKDLLAEGKGRDAGKITDQNTIKHGIAGGHTQVVGATVMPVTSSDVAAALVRKAAIARACEATAMNASSSRSHSVFMLAITGRHEASGTALKGALNLVDLAGSERLARSQAEGQRAKEACSINKSLSSLGDVFQALSSKSAHIPYRNSKLTHLLQPCLGGSGKTLMFVNINPEEESLQETVCSLRFAAKVNACETSAKGGAKRHVQQSGEPSGAPAQGGRRQSMHVGPLKRKAAAPLAPAGRNAKPRI